MYWDYRKGKQYITLDFQICTSIILSLRAVKFLEQCAFSFPFRHLLCYIGIFTVFRKVSEIVLIYLSYYSRALQLFLAEKLNH